jgi:hypothetical protein
MKMRAVSRPVWSLALAVLALASCKDDAGSDSGESADSSSSGDPTGATMSTTMTSSTTMPATTTSSGCIAGSENCECLDGECVGNLQCVDNSCKPGPEFDPDEEDRAVLGGLVVPVVVNVIADEFSWSQTAGPPIEWAGEGTSIQVPVPADAAVGEVITMRITAVRNTVEATFDYNITVLEPVFENYLAAVSNEDELGTSVGLDFDDNGNMWVASSEGFISRFGIGGGFMTRYDLAGSAGIRWGRLYIPEVEDDIDVLYAAQSSTQAISAYNPNNDSFETIFDALDDASPLGPIEVVLPDGGNLYTIDPMGGRIIRYTEDDATARVLTTEVESPAVLSFGPDANVLYVGGVGRVWRVPLLQDGMVAAPEVYLEIGDTADPLQTVGGMAFDEGGNMWVGVPGTSSVYIAPYAASGATVIARSFSDVGEGFSRFANLRFGSGDFGNAAVFWTNGSDRTVGRIETGLRGG